MRPRSAAAPGSALCRSGQQPPPASSRSVSLNAVTRRRERTDFHGLDQAVFDSETVANVFITKNGPVQVAHDLMHIDQDSPSTLWMEGNRLDVRVNLGPLLRPVSSDITMTANDAPSANQMEMAEGGLFPEEKACFADGERQLAERGPMGQPPCALRHAYDSGTNRPR